MKFVTYNIQFGVGRDGRLYLERIAKTVGSADVIALQEVTRAWPSPAHGDQPKQLAELLDGFHWVYAASVDVPHPDLPSDAATRGARQQFGNMLLSRTPIVSSRAHALPRLETLDIPRVALEGVIDTPGAGPLRIYSVHLAYKEVEERAQQVRAIMDLHGNAWGSESHITPRPELPPVDVSSRPRNTLVMGDFNMERSEPAYEAITAPHGDYYFSDVWVAAGNDPDSGVTMPANPDTETWKDESLDYGFISAPIANCVRSAVIDNDADGSDHQPVWFEIDL